MSDTTLGILIIIGIIILGIASGGDIFRGGSNPIPAESNPAIEYTYTDEDIYPSSNGSYVNSLGQTISTSYTGKVSIDYVGNPGKFDQYIQLGTNLNEGESVLITGWKIRSVITGQEATIGGAARVATVGIRDESPVLLTSGSYATIILGRSPIGTSFQTNQCMGFLDDRYNFEPSISYSCYRVIDDAPPLSRDINNACLNYIETLPGCRVPHKRDFEELGLTNACEEFLKTKVNYRTCVTNHMNDEDFLRKDWRLYTDFRGTFGISQRDSIQLLDNQGRVVDTYSI
jgi:hypothetical protein